MQGCMLPGTCAHAHTGTHHKRHARPFLLQGWLTDLLSGWEADPFDELLRMRRW